MIKFICLFFLLTVSSLANESLKKIANDKKNNYVNTQIQKFAQKIEEAFPRTEIGITSIENTKPEYSILTTQPILFNKESTNTFFWQGSAFIHDDLNRQTINLGLGYRKMFFAEKLLLGTNLFYDHEFPYDHKQTSLGFEAKTKPVEFNTNIYRGITDEKKGDDAFRETALDGYDFELGGHIPYIPSARLYAKQFFRDTKSQTDYEGQIYTMSFSDMILPGVSIDVGMTDHRYIENEYFVKITFATNKAANYEKNKKIIQDYAYTFDSMENERLTKVRRENKIIKKTSGFGVTFR
jgi:hypothetical protein